MKHNISKKLISALLALVMVVGMIPVTTLTVFAAHRCPDCEDWIDGSPYCDECYKCDACVDLCLECGKCSDCSGNEICDGCSDEFGKICVECAKEKGYHCPDCEGCYFGVGLWCEECGKCADCVDICVSCSANLGNGILCVDCAVEEGSHCPNCDNCFFEVQGWCEECGLCFECVEVDEICSGHLGMVICKDCASNYDSHCPECGGCYGDSGGWCEECGRCDDCSELCISCCEELGEVICKECAIGEGLHCPDCNDCYVECGGEFCTQCGICAACAEICSTHELCIDCAIEEGCHCPNCESCGDAYALCENCGEYCIDCASEFCENCNLCGECVKICQNCGSCEECATICPNCEEYCSECEGICDDCGLCLVCCEDIARMNGCDCDGEWVCVESTEWEEHFNECHTEAPDSHNVRASAVWNFDSNYHWHGCAYCNDAGHYTSKAAHSYDATGKCTTCYYVKNAKIQIVVQPKDVKYVCVTSAEEAYDESNIAHFSVKAIGNSVLTYTWCRRMYVGGQLTYVPLRNPGQGECYDGPNLAILAPTDACCNEYYICCFITDEAGNEVKTADALLTGRHDYQYYKEWRTHQRPYESAERNKYGHILKCVGETCEKVTHLLPHEDEDRDGYCDICDYEIDKILITKQPKDSKSAYVWGPLEDYDESNIAHFSVEAEGESELTYTWCRKQYVKGVLTYVPLKNPEPCENYTGPNLDILVPMGACCQEYTYACIITDEEGNETRTIDVVLKAKHNYQYYKQYKSHENPYYDAKQNKNGHILVCVGETCGKVSRLRQHEDADNNYCCDICDYIMPITDIELSVTEPKEGQRPGYAVGSASPAYYAAGGSSNYTNYRKWYVSNNGTDGWTLMKTTDTFVAGKYYKFTIDVVAASNRRFAVYRSELIALAIVNGKYVILPEKKAGQDPVRYVTVECNFGKCNDSVIEEITIENVTAPVAGEKPTYTATVRGNGYHIDANINKTYDAYWKNPPEQWPYIKNGIGWFDMTDFDWVYENDTFIPGHEYQIRVFLKTEDGYTFYHANDLTMLFTASVNGTAATGNTTTSWGLTEQTISASFPCQGKEITTVMVNGLSTPKAGETPDYTASVAYPEWYQLDPNYAGTNGIVWYDSDGYQMEPTDTFVAGKKYKVEIKLISATLNGANTSQFTSSASAYINGKQVVENGIWDAVYASANTVYIYYTFPKEAEYAGVMVSGSVTSFNDANGDITLQLIPKGYSEAAYETVVRGNTVEYKFSHVAAGTYTLKVMKENHVTREYTVVVGNSSVIQDVKIHLKGDITGDGRVNTSDVNRANLQAKGKTTLSDYEFACADVTGDGRVNTSDVNRINLHAKGKSLMW